MKYLFLLIMITGCTTEKCIRLDRLVLTDADGNQYELQCHIGDTFIVHIPSKKVRQ